MLSLCLALSTHLLAGDWNEIHPCIRFENEAFIAGAFLNSENNVSVYTGLTFERGPYFADLGIATGYSGAKVVPFIRGGVTVVEGVRVFVAPAYDVGTKTTGAVFGVEFSFESGT